MKHSLVLFTLMVLVTGEAAFTLDQNDYWKEWNTAKDAGDWKKGELAARAGLKAYPQVKEFAECLTWALRQQKRPLDAVKFIEPYYLADPQVQGFKEGLAYSLLDIGWAFYENNESSKALEPFKRAWEVCPDDQYVANAWGSVLRDTGKVDQALDVLEKAYGKWPENPYIKPNYLYALIVKANLLSEATDPLADEVFKKAGSLDSKAESYLHNYGNYLIKTKQFLKGISLLEECRKNYPGNTWIPSAIEYGLQEYHRSLAAAGDYTKALREAQNASARYPGEIWFLFDIFDYFIKIKDYGSADQALRKLAGEKKPLDYGKPFDWTAHEDYIHFRLQPIVWKYAERKEFEKAFALINAVAKEFPGSWWTGELKGILTFHSGKVTEGIAMVNQVYDAYIKDHPDLSKALTLPLPIKGTYLVWGNNRKESVTHAGMSRFCFDFLGSDAGGSVQKPGAPNPGKNEDYYGFGAGIYSVCDGEVVTADNDYPDIAPRLTPILGDGNTISIKGPDGFIYNYVHLKKGSLKFTKGQKVKAGDLLGELGNSGYTAIPHLHFGVYSSDWRVTIPVIFQDYEAGKGDGQWTLVKTGVPDTGMVIRSRP